MHIKRIGEQEMREAGIVSLSNKPTSPTTNGGDGLSPTALKERFDRLPRLVAERLNLLLDAISAMPELEDLSGGSIAEGMLTGMFPEERAEHTLGDLLGELLNGTAAAYLGVGGGKCLAEALGECLKAPRVRMGGESVLLEDGEEVRAGRLARLMLTLPSEIANGYRATLVFETLPGDGASTVTLPSGVLYSGEDTENGRFLPRGGKHYTCRFWYDGSVQAEVRGVRYEG